MLAWWLDFGWARTRDFWMKRFMRYDTIRYTVLNLRLKTYRAIISAIYYHRPTASSMRLYVADNTVLVKIFQITSFFSDANCPRISVGSFWYHARNIYPNQRELCLRTSLINTSWLLGKSSKSSNEAPVGESDWNARKLQLSRSHIVVDSPVVQLRTLVLSRVSNARRARCCYGKPYVRLPKRVYISSNFFLTFW